MKWYFVLNEDADQSYVENAQIAVLSCLANTTLRPNCLWDGARNAFTEWLGSVGVEVHYTAVTFLEALRQADGVRALRFQSARGAYLRIMIPSVEQTDEYVLYTDSDVVFQRDPTSLLETYKPHILAATTESDATDFDFFNSGVMILNVPNMRNVHKRFISYIEENVPFWTSFSPNDQGALNNFFRSGWTVIDNKLNWKPYWGLNDDAYIVHFHGARPHEIVRHLAAPHKDPTRRQLNTPEKLQSSRKYVQLYASFIEDTGQILSEITNLAVTGRLIAVTWKQGEEMVLGRDRVLNVWIDQEVKIAITAPFLTSPTKTGIIYYIAPDTFREPGRHHVRVAFDFLPNTETSIETISDNDEQPGVWVGHVSAQSDIMQAGCLENRQRLLARPAGGLKPRYINLSACQPAAASDVHAKEAMLETVFPTLGFGPVYIDRIQTGILIGPGGLVIDRDQVIDENSFKKFNRYDGNDLPAGVTLHKTAQALRFTFSDSLLNGATDENSLSFSHDRTSLDGLIPFLIRLGAFLTCPETCNQNFIIDALTPWQIDVLQVLGLRERVREIGTALPTRFERVSVVSGNGSVTELFGSFWFEWLEANLSATLPSQHSRNLSLLKHHSPKGSDLANGAFAALSDKGFLTLPVGAETLGETIPILRQSKLIITDGSSGDAILAFAHPSASILEIMVGDKFQSSLAYRTAMAKRLGYGVLLVNKSLWDASMEAAPLLVKQIMDSSSRLLKSNYSNHVSETYLNTRTSD